MDITKPAVEIIIHADQLEFGLSEAADLRDKLHTLSAICALTFVTDAPDKKIIICNGTSYTKAAFKAELNRDEPIAEIKIIS